MFTYDCQIEIRDFAFVCFLDLFELQALDTAKSRGSLNTATTIFCASGRMPSSPKRISKENAGVRPLKVGAWAKCRSMD